LQSFGLNKHNVLDYFYCSPFYDKNSNNEVIKMQHLDYNLLAGMTGLEYVLESDFENLFVISKRKRFSPNNWEVVSYYYILNNTIYQCPDIRSVLDARIVFIFIYIFKTFRRIDHCFILINQSDYFVM
jgi:mediator of RNA polymerase II transcription subunit 6